MLEYQNDISTNLFLFFLLIIATGRPWENGLNWIPDPAPATFRDHGIEQLPISPEPERPKEERENHPPASHPPRLPRKLRPRRMKQTQQKHPLPVANENSPGTDFRPRWMKRTPQKHPLPVAGTANKNSPGTDLRPPPLPSQPAARPTPWNPDTPGRLYKQAQRRRVMPHSRESAEFSLDNLRLWERHTSERDGVAR